jgi:diguanylate cyclase (GGDEF)-like protein/PAS domain S-box-containing protein
MIDNNAVAIQELLDLATVISTTTEPQLIYREVTGKAQKLLKLDCAVFLPSTQDGLHLDAAADLTPALPSHALQDLARHVLTTGHPFTVEDLTVAARLPGAASLCRAGIRSAIGAPVQAAGRCSGVLIGYNRGQRRFSRAEVALYQGIARQAALAIHNVIRLQSLEADLERLRALLDANPDCIIFKDPQGHWLLANKTVLQLLQFDETAYQGKTDAELACPATPYRQVLLDCKANEERLGQPGSLRRCEAILSPAAGEERIFDIVKVPVFYPDGSRQGLLVLGREITEHRRMEEHLRLLAQVFANSNQGIIILDTRQCLLAVNQAFTEITGYPADEVIGCSMALLNSDPQYQETFHRMCANLDRQQHWQGELWSRRKSGEIYPQWLAIHSINNEQGVVTHYIGMFSDITERKLAENRIHHLAHHDVLTNLPNRVLLQDRINQALAQAVRRRHCMAILFIDLDHFKVINDSLGHDLGDLLLKAVAERMAACTRSEDTVARQGGDEFVILLPNLRQPQDAAVVAQKLIDKLIGSPFKLYHHELHITPSIGISVYPHDGTHTQDLLKNADAAMYYAKERGRNTYQFYTTEMNATVSERLSLANSLRRAIEHGEFFLHYQPQVDTVNGRILGMETLIRWEHPEQGMISPTKFIPLAEEIGLIAPIGEWVLHNACQQYKRWWEAGYRGLRLAVNLSARQFRQGNLLLMIERVLQETGVSPDSLELELTESTFMQQTEETIKTLRALSDLGVQLAIDDFGIGYSNLSYLRRFPLHTLKIDQSFIRDISSDPDDDAIVSAIIAMAHSLKLIVIAEGVETSEQMEFLRQRQCDVLQGYALSKPLSVEAFTQFLVYRFHPSQETLAGLS